MWLLHCAQCIIISPVCGWVCVCVVLLPWLLEIACIDPHQTGSVGEGSDHLQLIKFWPSHTPGRRSAVGRNFWLCLTTPSVCVSSEHFIRYDQHHHHCTREQWWYVISPWGVWSTNEWMNSNVLSKCGVYMLQALVSGVHWLCIFHVCRRKCVWRLHVILRRLGLADCRRCAARACFQRGLGINLFLHGLWVSFAFITCLLYFYFFLLRGILFSLRETNVQFSLSNDGFFKWVLSVCVILEHRAKWSFWENIRGLVEQEFL